MGSGFAGLVMLALAAGGTVETRGGQPPAFVPLGEVADAPRGFVQMCRADPPNCANGTALGPADPPSRRLVEHVNTYVNRRTLQRSDIVTYGVDELWRAAGAGTGAVGDCEDLALEKRRVLLVAGVSPDRLMLAAVYVRGQGLHSVLVARLPDGDYVLDSLRGSVERWDRLGYHWLRVQSPGDPMQWRRLADG